MLGSSFDSNRLCRPLLQKEDTWPGEGASKGAMRGNRPAITSCMPCRVPRIFSASTTCQKSDGVS